MHTRGMLCASIASGKIETMAKKVENEKNVKKFLFCLYKQASSKKRWWWWKVNFETWCISNIETHENHIGCIIDDEFEEKKSSNIKVHGRRRVKEFFVFKLHVCIHTFFIQQSHDVVLPSRMMKGAPWEKSHFFLLLTIYFILFFVYGDTTTIIRGAASWVVQFGWGRNGSVCGKMKCLTLCCLFSIFSIFFSSIFIFFTSLLFTHSSIPFSFYSPFF